MARRCDPLGAKQSIPDATDKIEALLAKTLADGEE
jgi:hypothetical protein